MRTKRAAWTITVIAAIIIFAGCAGVEVKVKKPAATPAGTQKYVWKSVISGGGGFIPGIIYHPAERGLVYLRTDMGGAYKWNDRGKEWDCITDMFGKDESEYDGVLSIGLDPNDAGLVYMITGKYTQGWAGNGAFQISKDRGKTWKTVPLPFKVGGNENGRGCGERIAVDPNKGSIIFMGTTKDGLWRSADSGNTWAKVKSFLPANLNFVIFDRASGVTGSATNRIIAAAADDAGSLYISDDAGTSWAAVAGQPAGLMALRADMAQGRLFLTFSDSPGPNGATRGAVWKYNMANKTWKDLKAPDGTGGFSGISVDAGDPKHILISTLDRWSEHDDVFQSTDGGVTWSPLLKNAKWDYSCARYTDMKNGIKPHWIADVKIDPFDPNTAMWVTGYGLWAGKNILSRRATWYFNDRGIEETVPMQVISPPSGARLFTAVGDIDGFRYEDKLDRSPPNRYMPVKGTTLSIACAWNDPKIMAKTFNRPPFGARSRDNGKSWEDFPVFPDGTSRGGSRSIAVSLDGKNIVWAPEKGKGWSAEKNKIFCSSDGGASWKECRGAPDGYYHPVADTVNPEKFYAFNGDEGTLYTSTDAGLSFSSAASGMPPQKDNGWQAANIAAAPGVEGDVWIIPGSGGLYRTTDSGKSVSTVDTVDDAFRLGFGKSAPSGTYPAVFIWGVISGTTGFFRSDDAGATWVRINDDRHRYGWIHCITGDPRIYGRCYISAEGRGTFYGDIR